jgi:hypothetical protein
VSGSELGGDDAAAVRGRAGLLVMRSMVSLSDGSRLASRNGKSPRLLWRLAREPEPDPLCRFSLFVPTRTPAAGSNSEESENGCDGYEMGTEESRRGDEKLESP